MFEIFLLDVFSLQNFKDILPHDNLPQEVKFKKRENRKKETIENSIHKGDYPKSFSCITRKAE